jgi:hypothetical protein
MGGLWPRSVVIWLRDPRMGPRGYLWVHVCMGLVERKEAFRAVGL